MSVECGRAKDVIEGYLQVTLRTEPFTPRGSRHKTPSARGNLQSRSTTMRSRLRWSATVRLFSKPSITWWEKPGTCSQRGGSVGKETLGEVEPFQQQSRCFQGLHPPVHQVWNLRGGFPGRLHISGADHLQLWCFEVTSHRTEERDD